MLLKTSYQRDLDGFCKEIIGGDFNIREVTKGALTQARAKLNPWAFRRLNSVAVDSFYEGADYVTWQGHRVLAVDGSKLMLPNSDSIAAEFGVHGFGPNGDSKRSMATCSLLYDVLNHVTIDAQIGSYVTSEKALMKKHLAHLEPGDLLLADRGYTGIELMLSLSGKEVDFCIRLKSDWRLQVKSFVKTGKRQAIVEFDIPTNFQTKDEHGIVATKMKCRLVRIDLPDGEIEVLCTSLLDTRKYHYDQFGALYQTRWNVEEAYKLLKSRAELEAFSGKTARSVYQDFHAKVLMMTLCATLAFPIEQKVREEFRKEKTNNKNDQKINRTYALATTRDSLIQIMIKGLHKATLEITDALIEKTREVIRPNRKYERNKKPKRQHHINYKPL